MHWLDESFVENEIRKKKYVASRVQREFYFSYTTDIHQSFGFFAWNFESKVDELLEVALGRTTNQYPSLIANTFRFSLFFAEADVYLLMNLDVLGKNECVFVNGMAWLMLFTFPLQDILIFFLNDGYKFYCFLMTQLPCY